MGLRGKQPSKARRLRAFMDQHPGALEMTHRQIADAVGCSITLVARMKRATGGYVPRPYTRRKDSLGRVEEPDLDAKEPEVAKVVESPSLSTDAKRKLLTRLAESDDSRTEARISAIRELHRIDESVGSAKELGPGPPLTVEDRVSRLSLLIAACGPTVHAAALALAQKEWE